ncbi:hypothetical protein K438DRAFT_1961884 [Mycena galopus ATCC 62051]|nr:hypothetical protein K438DRAFT_1961884 [Mycena galopus ATCC 62051]
MSFSQRQSSIFRKRNSSAVAPKTAASYFSALSEADTLPIPTVTPAALSLSSTGDSEDYFFLKHENERLDDGLEYPLRPPASEQVFNTQYHALGFWPLRQRRVKFVLSLRMWTELSLQLGPQDLEPPYYIAISTHIRFMYPSDL